MTACYGVQEFKASHVAPYGMADITPDLLLETLDLIDLAIMLVERSGRVLHANRAARTLLAEEDIVRLSQGRLATFSAKASAALQTALAGMTRASGVLPRHGVVVPLADGDGDVRAASWVLPLSGGRPGGFAGLTSGRAAVIVRRIAPPAAISTEFFARCYGVTQAERRLLEALAEGMTVAEAGQALKVSLNTVKSHLKSLFAKTGTNRQSELMRLALTTMPPAAM
jgi:DNA-binding CsgD family transcriptional regulator